MPAEDLDTNCAKSEWRVGIAVVLAPSVAMQIISMPGAELLLETEVRHERRLVGSRLHCPGFFYDSSPKMPNRAWHTILLLRSVLANLPAKLSQVLRSTTVCE